MMKIIAVAIGVLGPFIYAQPIYACPHQTCYTQSQFTDQIHPGYDKCTIGKDFKGVTRCVNGNQCYDPNASLKKEGNDQVASAEQCKVNQG